MVVHTCNPNTQEVEAGESGVESQPVLHSEGLSPKTNLNRSFGVRQPRPGSKA
jgi:hypothetical protein